MKNRHVLKTLEYLREAKRRIGPTATEAELAAMVKALRVVDSVPFQEALRMLAREDVA